LIDIIIQMSDQQVPIPIELIGSQKIPRIPDISTTSNRIPPVNGSNFTGGDQVIFDVQNQAGYLNPDSIYLSYKVTAVAAGGGAINNSMIGIPLYTPLSQLQILFNSQQQETINNFNVVCFDWVYTKMSTSRRQGYGYALGMTGAGVSRALAANAGTSTSFSVSGPMPNILSNAEKWIPLYLMPSIRIIFQLDSLANMFTNLTNVASVTFSNFELAYDIVNVPQPIERAVISRYLNSDQKYVIKTSSFSVSSSPFISAGSSG